MRIMTLVLAGALTIFIAGGQALAAKRISNSGVVNPNGSTTRVPRPAVAAPPAIARRRKRSNNKTYNPDRTQRGMRPRRSVRVSICAAGRAFCARKAGGSWSYSGCAAVDLKQCRARRHCTDFLKYRKSGGA